LEMPIDLIPPKTPGCLCIVCTHKKRAATIVATL